MEAGVVELKAAEVIVVSSSSSSNHTPFDPNYHNEVIREILV